MFVNLGLSVSQISMKLDTLWPVTTNRGKTKRLADDREGAVKNLIPNQRDRYGADQRREKEDGFDDGFNSFERIERKR